MCCVQPELCANQVAIDTKISGVDSDKRGRQAALASFKLFQDAHTRIEYTPKVDQYSFGVTMYEIMCHVPPWDGVPQGKVYEKVAQGERPRYGSLGALLMAF